MSDSDVPFVGNPAKRALDAAGIRTLGDLAQRSDAGVAALHGVGPKAMRVWREALAQHGLEFAETDADVEGHPS